MWPSSAHINSQLDPCFAASKHTTTQSATLGLHLHPRAHKLLLISHPTKKRRLSWLSTQQASNLLKVACKWPAVRIEPQPESYESTLTTRPLAPNQSSRHEQLAQSWYLAVHRLGTELWTFRSCIKRPNCWASQQATHMYQYSTPCPKISGPLQIS